MNKFNSGKAAELQMVNKLDDLAEFEEFQEHILPKLRAAIKAGKSAEDIYKMATSAAAGKIATMAIRETDPLKALALCRELLDRSGGKATERREIKAEITQLSEAELDALIESEFEEGQPSEKH